MRVPLGDTIYPAFFTHDATGASSDADSTPTVDVREDGAAAFTTGVTVANVTTGEYEATIVCTSGNGYEEGKWYEVCAAATVDSVTSKQSICRFQIGDAIPQAFTMAPVFLQLSEATQEYRTVFFFMGDTTSGKGVTGLTDTTITTYIKRPTSAAAEVSDSGLVTEISSGNMPGVYTIEIPGTLTAALGNAALHFVSTGCRTCIVPVVIIAPDLFDAVRLGLTALPNADAEAAGGLYTRGTGAGQINQPANGMVDVNAVRHLGTAYATPTTAGVPEVDVTFWDNEAVVGANQPGVPLVDVQRWAGDVVATTTVAGVPEVDVTHWRGTAAAAPTVAGIPKVEVSSMATDSISAASVSTAAAEKIRDSILDYAYRSGRTVRGVIRRLGAALEKATGLKGSTVTYFQPDGVTEEFHVTQDVANGTRTNPVVTNSEVP